MNLLLRFMAFIIHACLNFYLSDNAILNYTIINIKRTHISLLQKIDQTLLSSELCRDKECLDRGHRFILKNKII